MRWWLVDRFTPDGRPLRMRVSGERFTTVMGRFALELETTVPDRLGADQARRFRLSPRRPRDFRVADIIKSDAVLRALDDLRKRHDLDAGTLRARVADLVGVGRLTEALDSHQSPSAEPASGGNSQPRDLDTIFSKAETRGNSVVDRAKSGVDKLIGALLEGGSVKRTIPASRDASDVLATALDATACDILESSEVAPLEEAWRSLRTLVAASPGARHLDLELVDGAEGSVEQLQRALPVAPDERPDVVIVARPVSDLDALEALGRWAHANGALAIIELRDEHELDQEQWDALRAAPWADSICVSANPIALALETTRVGPRQVFGSAAVGLAALVASNLPADDPPGSFRGFEIVGPIHGWVAPAAHDVELRAGERRTIPTRVWASAPLQQEAADLGIVLLGSAAGSDKVVLGAATTLAGKALAPQIVSRYRARVGT